MKDFIIVGRGLAASCLMHTFARHQISFTVLGSPSLSSSSRVAAGIWNPIVFKRLTKSWMADDLIPALKQFYKTAELLTGKKFMTERNILRFFSETQEQVLWEKKARNELDEYLSQEVYSTENNKGCFGKVLQAGNIDVATFLEATEKYFGNDIQDELFEYAQLQISEEYITYKTHRTKNIVFCEGWLVKNNPFFNWIPFKPAKGEVLSLKIPGLDLDNNIVNRNSFLFKISSSLYRLGATYNWDQLDDQPSATGLQELEEKLKTHTSLAFELIKHEAGVRPSTIDHRPVLGKHPEFNRLFIFNGLGTKGVMLAPYFSEKFVHFYLQKQTLAPEVGIARFYHLYEKKT